MSFLIGTPHNSGSGYYMNDDTASGGVRAEADIKTCTHCQAIIKMQAWKLEGAYCAKCAAPICWTCGLRAESEGCVPFNKRLGLHLDASYHDAQRRKLAGLEPAPLPSDAYLGLIIAKD